MSTPDNKDDPFWPDDPLRPRIGRRPRTDEKREPTLRVAVLRRLARAGGLRRATKGASTRKGRIAVRPPHALSRRCVVKGRYVALKDGGLAKARVHLAYLERDGVERDGSPGRLYGADESFSREEFRARLDGEQRQFRFIVSPEDGDRLDLKEFARAFVRQVEKDTGRRLIWAAVNHHNTDNPHVHIVIRGVDRNGDDLRIDGPYIAQGMRWRAQEIVTRELGRRSERDLERERSIDVHRDRFTEIDRVIESRASAERMVTVANLLATPGPEGRTCIARLQVLEQMRLASPERSGTWRLADGWKEQLEAIGERNDIIQRLYPLVQNRAVAFRIVDAQKSCPAFEGVVAGKGLDDEISGRMFAAVVTPAGDPYYVRLAPEMAERLPDGERVRVEFVAERWAKPADHIIARFAQEHGGVYDPVQHQRALETLQRGRGQAGEPTPAQRVEANVRRLERLARYRLAGRLPGGRWQVAADLVAQLEAREKSHPQHRLRIQPVREWEREELGRAIARRTGLAYVPEPAGLKGRCFACEPTRSGTEFLRVVDEAGRRFALIPKPAGQWLEGHVVTLTRDAAGRLAISRGPEISR